MPDKGSGKEQAYFGTLEGGGVQLDMSDPNGVERGVLSSTTDGDGLLLFNEHQVCRASLSTTPTGGSHLFLRDARPRAWQPFIDP